MNTAATKPSRVAVALGSNLGHRESILARAREAVANLPQTRVLGLSSVLETAPLGGMPQGLYLNQMLLIETTLTPRELLAALQSIERDEGRERSERWGPRTLDCDIVLFDEFTIREPGLTIPHPGLPERDFWHRELDELGVHWRTRLPDARHPNP